jgi:hypothetical protein
LLLPQETKGLASCMLCHGHLNLYLPRSDELALLPYHPISLLGTEVCVLIEHHPSGFVRVLNAPEIGDKESRHAVVIAVLSIGLDHLLATHAL